MARNHRTLAICMGPLKGFDYLFVLSLITKFNESFSLEYFNYFRLIRLKCLTLYLQAWALCVPGISRKRSKSPPPQQNVQKLYSSVKSLCNKIINETCIGKFYETCFEYHKNNTDKCMFMFVKSLFSTVITHFKLKLERSAL